MAELRSYAEPSVTGHEGFDGTRVAAAPLAEELEEGVSFGTIAVMPR